MNKQTELLTLKILEFKEQSRHPSLTEHILDNFSDEETQVKNVCAKLHVSLVDRLDNTLSVLGISKRRFIETAVITALNEFDQLATDLDIDEHFRDMEDAMKQESSK